MAECRFLPDGLMYLLGMLMIPIGHGVLAGEAGASTTLGIGALPGHGILPGIGEVGVPVGEDGDPDGVLAGVLVGLGTIPPITIGTISIAIQAEEC